MRREDQELLNKAKSMGIDKLIHETERKVSRTLLIFTIIWLVSLILVGAWLYNLGREEGRLQGETTGRERAMQSADYRDRSAKHLESRIRMQERDIQAGQKQLIDLQDELARMTNTEQETEGYSK